MTLFPFQQQAVSDIFSAIDGGDPGVVLSSPPRAGKTVIFREVARIATQERDWRVTIYSHRILLTRQMVDKIAVEGDLDVGIRAAGWATDDDPRIQICSIQTEASQVLRRQKRELTSPNLVIVDELHLQCGKTACEIMRRHQAEGAAILGVTATPVDIPTNIFTKLIPAVTNSELRALGQHVPCVTYGCEEIDTSKIKVLKDGSFSPHELRKVFKIHQIFGHVLHHFNRLNPEHKPTLLFAPGVKESLWFADEFGKEGISAVHIDGSCVHFNSACPQYAGETFRGQAGIEKRTAALHMSRDGDVKIITNRYVLREAIDCPWIEVGIGATPFGALHSYIQAGSRILTASPGKTKAIWIDHGGNWHRHGSLNEDRVWHLGCAAGEFAMIRKQQHIAGEKEEPARCPSCGAIRGPKWHATGKCPVCGFAYTQSVRPVLQASGELRMMTGNVHKKRVLLKSDKVLQLWRSHFYRCRNAGMTFTQAEALFAREHRWRWLPRTLPNMPKAAADWVRTIGDVHPNRLYDLYDSPYCIANPAEVDGLKRPKSSPTLF